MWLFQGVNPCFGHCPALQRLAVRPYRVIIWAEKLTGSLPGEIKERACCGPGVSGDCRGLAFMFTPPSRSRFRRRSARRNTPPGLRRVIEIGFPWKNHLRTFAKKMIHSP